MYQNQERWELVSQAGKRGGRKGDFLTSLKQTARRYLDMNLERSLKQSSGTSMLRHFSRFHEMSLRRVIGSCLRAEWML